MDKYTFVITLNSGEDEFWEEAKNTNGESIKECIETWLDNFEFDYDGYEIKSNEGVLLSKSSIDNPYQKESKIKDQFENLIETIREYKPDDRSARDRVYAITLTDLEKAYAYFITYVDV